MIWGYRYFWKHPYSTVDGCRPANQYSAWYLFFYHEVFGWVISTNPKCRMEGAKTNMTGVTATIRSRNSKVNLSNKRGSTILEVLV